ncbi:kinesin-like protein KIN-4A isoform X1 [Zingiber officinale]|uniref:kinesin-like protein KIN-4A isoform X1 n=2 Tax=Zingiber officinale TaxID=94328 RepID=UPI001C4C17F2|nr:kinesin-like protein KIN-4A isoform X1 [Zingiber officinale]XP_042447165.1 kinesin-like protein KIN-4A isoform X1 [Zingiber officinale]
MAVESGEDCCVKVAVHVRPLIGDERQQGCKDCVTVVPGKPQVQIGTHSFTFDHVYGSTGTPSSAIFEECVAPLVDGLFQGYNATVLAYGQTGSGKTYTMGTACKDGSQTGLIPQVMNSLFSKIEALKNQAEFQLRVSFIEILKEEVRDLLDSSSVSKIEAVNGHSGKLTMPGKALVQIREASNGAITLAGSTEIFVSTQKEMAACLEQGSLIRATGSTNMNNQSSRSHAIFTITLEQMCKIGPNVPAEGTLMEDMNHEYLSAKLHLVDLAGSERAKRTGSDGLRFKEGVHINRGLLALGNVISALGDEKKRKEGAHVPYRDSKLTRLLQDSLGGNSRTVMIACISPADVNTEETLNTLKYANRARNIQNKPIVNRNPISEEIHRMRQHIEYLQAELACHRGGGASDDIQALKEKISWLEATNEDLCMEIYEYRSRFSQDHHFDTDSEETGNCFLKGEDPKRSLHNAEGYDYHMAGALRGDSKEIDEVAKEWEHTMLQDSMGKELNELNRQLEQKESEMKMFCGFDTFSLKQHFKKKLMELEEEKRAVQQERDRLLAEVENLAAASDGQGHKLPENHLQKLKALEAQILDLKKKQENQVQLSKQKQRSEEAAKKLQEEIQFIKSQKVQLQHKIKQEAEQFRQWKASREKELLQLKKEGRRNEYERHKLRALNQRQKLVLQRKTEEAAMATKKLKELLEARKSSARENSVIANGHSPGVPFNEKSLQRWLDHELEVMVHVHEVRNEYEKQSQVRAALAEELTFLKQEEASLYGASPPRVKNGNSRMSSLSPNALLARITSLENMVNISSNTLVAMASQLSEAEERERSYTGHGRWNQLRSMGEAKSLLHYVFNVAADARCKLREKEIDIKELKEQLNELVSLLRLSEARRKEMEKQQKMREQAVAVPLTTSPSANSNGSLKHSADDTGTPLSPIAVPAQKQLKYTAGIANSPNKAASSFDKQPLKMVPIGHLPVGKKLAITGHGGKLWRWKRSHHQWLLQFKWKWQKPWKLSEWIRRSDETIMRARPRSLPLHRIS